MYQLVNLSDLTLDGDPATLPPEFVGLSDDVLADFSAAMDPPPVGYEGKGLWPVTVSAPDDLDPATEIATDEIVSRTLDAASRTVVAVYGKRDLTADELAARNPVPQQISDRQFFQALALQDMISNEEALAAVKTGEIPSAMASFIAMFPADQQFSAQMLLAGATIFERSNPLVPAFMAAQTPPMTDADIDDLWRFAGAL